MNLSSANQESDICGPYKELDKEGSKSVALLQAPIVALA